MDPAPKVVLQNRLVRCRTKLEELKPVMDSKRTQHRCGASRPSNFISKGEASINWRRRSHRKTSEMRTKSPSYAFPRPAESQTSRLIPSFQTFIDSLHDLTAHATSEHILLAEMETISEALDGDEGEQRPHEFKSASFSIPTTCGYCQVEGHILLFSVPEFVTSLF